MSDKKEKFDLKRAWNFYTDNFGLTIIHPQFLKLRQEEESLKRAITVSSGKLLDIGCGRMQYRQRFENKGIKYIGLDHPKISKMYKTSIKPDVIADAHKLPFEKSTFDTITLFQVVSYFDDPLSVLRQAEGVLKKGGRIIIATSFLYPVYDIPYDKVRYTPSGIEKLVKDAGFKILSVKTNGGFLDFWIGSLQVFLVKRIFDVIKLRSILKIPYLLFLICISVPIIVIGNIFVVLVSPLLKSFSVFPNYFPQDILVIAKKS